MNILEEFRTGYFEEVCPQPKFGGSDTFKLKIYFPSIGRFAFMKGESPTGDRWDMSPCREEAAYKLSTYLGLNLVPMTVQRTYKVQRTYNVSIQDWIAGESRPKEISRNLETASIALFDSLIFNRDRHGGNVLWDERGRIHLIDNAFSFPALSKGGNAYTRSPFITIFSSISLWQVQRDMLHRLLEDGDQLYSYLPLPSEGVTALLERAEWMYQHNRLITCFNVKQGYKN